MCPRLPIRVFVYGTLKRGEPNANVLTTTDGQHRFIGEGRTKVPYPLIVASKYNIPFVLNEPGKGHQIQGEVYEIDNVKLTILDALEAYPTLYWRQEEKILMSNNTETTAWIYLMRKWRPDIYEHATPMMSNYSSKGDHGREYVVRYVRAKDILEDDYNLYADIQGDDPADPLTKAASRAKAINDTKYPS
uniref:Gamma-glutamylcyclotransferase family protein n=1 Tax=Haemonchus contortus TaxID=6289 RepID=A0A7I5E9T0_HAECO